jgi:membrane protease YdiL (CAAX protease family)
VALVAARLSPVAWRSRLRLGPPRCSWSVVAVLVIGVLALSQGLDALAVLLGIQNHGFLPRLRQLVRSLPPGSLAVLAVIMGAAPGFCEEVFFRGYLQARLIERWGPAAAVATSAVLFGALHLDPVQAPMATVLGLYLGHVAWRAESIWPAVVCHAVNNVVATVGGALIPENMGGRGACVVQIVVGLALALGSLALLHRGTPRSAVTS